MKVRIKNRSAGNVVYSVPDMKVRRDFLPGEIKMIDSKELEQLHYSQGGRLLITQYLQILDEDVRDQVEGTVEPEYNFGEEDIKNLILNGSLDSFLDALDFAPMGVIDLIKKYAVSLPMVDINKMNALKEKTGFDVMSAINNSTADGGEAEAPAEKARRRVPVEETPKKTTRRTSKKTAEETSAE